MKNSFRFIAIFVVFLCFSGMSQQVLSQPLQLTDGYQEGYSFVPRNMKFYESNDGKNVLFLRRNSFRSYHIFSASAYGERSVVELTSGESSLASSFKISPDSKHVVYATPDALYSVPIEGGTSVKLNVRSFDFGVDYHISSDSKTVFYLTGQGLWAVPIIGGLSSEITVDQPDDQVYGILEVSPDQKFLVFSAYNEGPEGNQRAHILRAHIGRDAMITDLLANAEGNFRINKLLISPDSKTVVYKYRENESSVENIASVSSTGDLMTPVPKNLVSNRLITLLSISADSERAYFSTGEFGKQDDRILSYSLNAQNIGTTVLVDAEDGKIENIRVLKENRGIVYSTVNSPISLREVKFWRADAEASSEVTLASIISNRGYPPVSFSKDETVMSVVTENQDFALDSYEKTVTVIDLVDFESRVISKRVVASASANESLFNRVLVGNPEKRVVFLKKLDSDGKKLQLRSVSVNGGASSPLSSTSINEPIVFRHQFSHDEKRIFFTAGSVRGDRARFKLFAVDVDSSEEEFCFPLKAKNQKLATVCL